VGCLYGWSLRCAGALCRVVFDVGAALRGRTVAQDSLPVAGRRSTQGLVLPMLIRFGSGGRSRLLR
jgi:hypothetical protein